MPKRLLTKALRSVGEVSTQSLLDNPALQDHRYHAGACARLGAIARQAAEVYAGRDKHRLTVKEYALVEMLENAGCLTVNDPPNGFVGKTT